MYTWDQVQITRWTVDEPDSGRFGVLHENIQSLILHSEGKTLADRVLIGIFELLSQQGAELRTMERSIGNLQDQLSTMLQSGPGVNQPDERRPPQAEPPPRMIRGKRWTDICSFCGRTASENEPVFSSPTGGHICTACLDVLNAMRGGG